MAGAFPGRPVRVAAGPFGASSPAAVKATPHRRVVNARERRRIGLVVRRGGREDRRMEAHCSEKRSGRLSRKCLTSSFAIHYHRHRPARKSMADKNKPDGRRSLQEFTVKRRKGETIYVEGDLGSEMYVVQSGAVRIFRSTGGVKQELAIMEKGDFFGEIAVLEGLPRTASAEALDECEIIEINSTTFDKMIARTSRSPCACSAS